MQHHAELAAQTAGLSAQEQANLAQGVCDTPVPSIVIEGAQRAAAEGYNLYTRCDGLLELRQAIANKLARYNGIQADPERHITVSAGATGSFHCACAALLDPGDEVIVFEPYYQYHLSALLAVEAVPVIVKMQAPQWTYTIGDVERAITPLTKAIIVNSPCNRSCPSTTSNLRSVIGSGCGLVYDLGVKRTPFSWPPPSIWQVSSIRGFRRRMNKAPAPFGP